MNKNLFDKINVNKNKSIFENIERSEGDVFEQVSKNKKEERKEKERKRKKKKETQKKQFCKNAQ